MNFRMVPCCYSYHGFGVKIYDVFGSPACCPPLRSAKLPEEIDDFHFEVSGFGGSSVEETRFAYLFL